MEKNPKLINIGPTSIPEARVTIFQLAFPTGQNFLVLQEKETTGQDHALGKGQDETACQNPGQDVGRDNLSKSGMERGTGQDNH